MHWSAALAPGATAGSADGPQQPRRFTGPHASGGPRGVRTSPGRAALSVRGGTAASVPPAWGDGAGTQSPEQEDPRLGPPSLTARAPGSYKPVPAPLGHERSTTSDCRRELGGRVRGPHMAGGEHPERGEGTDLQHGREVSTEGRL